MAFFRWLFGVSFAAVVTGGLFLVMAGLIKMPFVPEKPRETPKIVITPQIEPTPPGGVEPEPPRNFLKKFRTQLLISLRGKKVDPIPVTVSNPTPPGPGEFGHGTIGGPTIITAPPYPESCRSHNAQGTVLVQFDVTPEGNVVNPIILESAHRCFNRTVLRTVVKWKYTPGTKNGKPAMRYGVIERFSFQLTE